MVRQSIPSLLLKCLLALVVALLLTPEAVLADVVEPSDRITTGVVVREQATADSAAIGLLRPNERLEFIGSVPQWNRVRLADGRIGYVSKSWTRVVAAAPATTEFTVHVVDVGTGLAVLLQGKDFALLYDGGSNDDLARGDQNRLLAYFRAAVPTMTRIDHLILSHPHRDHVELLPDVVSRYEIKNLWDSGAVNDICGYRVFITAVQSKPSISYRSARNDAGTHPVEFDAKSCYGTALPKETIQLVHGRRISHEKITLGLNAEMTFLHVDGTDYRGEYNRNSLVVRVDLGATRILLMGDAEAGGRSPLGFQPKANSVEGALLACCRDALRADILVVGHHGSKTSSRLTFLDAVGAKIFVVSAGPTKYATVVLPDEEVTSELTRRGTLFRTDLKDATCGSNPAKIGADADGRPGGCDNIRIVIRPNNAIDANYWSQAD